MLSTVEKNNSMYPIKKRTKDPLIQKFDRIKFIFIPHITSCIQLMPY